jgi:uncharacterized protein YjbI with pentapeptide repeats
MSDQVDDHSESDELPLPEDDEAPSRHRRSTAISALIDAVNQSSSTTRNSWIFFLSALTYLFVAVASVTHRDLLLDAPIKLPILAVDISLSRFFNFAPLLLLLIHTGLLLQHAALADKARALDEALTNEEEANAKITPTKGHPQRLEISTYFFSQCIAGSRQESWRRFLSALVVFLSLGILPTALLFYFQASYLPFHDERATSLHQIYVVASAALSTLFLFGITKRANNRRRIGGRPAIVTFVAAEATIALFAVFVATVPESKLDVVTRQFNVLTKPVGETSSRQSGWHRDAFFLTAVFFEGDIDFARGQATSWFSRNLVVPDAHTLVTSGDGKREVVYTLRDRNLQYAVLDRTNLQRFDFTNALLTGASLKGADLRGARFGCASKGNPPSFLEEMRNKFVETGKAVGSYVESITWGTQGTYYGGFDSIYIPAGQCQSLVDTDLTDADLRGVQIKAVSLDYATMNGANLQGVDLQGTDLTSANLIASNLDGALLYGTRIGSANFSLATLNGATLLGVDANSAVFMGADLWGISLLTTDASDAEFSGADLRGALVWDTQTPMAPWLADFSEIRIEKPDIQELNLIRQELARIGKEGRTGPDEEIGQLQNVLQKYGSPDTAEWGTSPQKTAWSAFKDAMTERKNGDHQKRLSLFFGEAICAEPLLLQAILFRRRHEGWGDLFYSPDTFVFDKQAAAKRLEKPEVSDKLRLAAEHFQKSKRKNSAWYDLYSESTESHWSPELIFDALHAGKCERKSEAERVLWSKQLAELAKIVDRDKQAQARKAEDAAKKAKPKATK